jgi:hypothetical protein
MRELTLTIAVGDGHSYKAHQHSGGRAQLGQRPLEPDLHAHARGRCRNRRMRRRDDEFLSAYSCLARHSRYYSITKGNYYF